MIPEQHEIVGALTTLALENKLGQTFLLLARCLDVCRQADLKNAHISDIQSVVDACARMLIQMENHNQKA